MPTTTRLWRYGNAGGPQFANVRANDAVTYDVGGVTWVRGGQRGISTFDETITNAGTKRWGLPSGTLVPAGLSLVHDNNPQGHWSWPPAHDMTLAAYVALLGSMNGAPPFRGPFTLPPYPAPFGAAADVEEDAAVNDGGAGPVPARTATVTLSDKAHAFVLAAIDDKIAALSAELADPATSEDDAGGIDTDLTLYRLIRAHVAAQEPA